jgi:hypothetical protein
MNVANSWRVVDERVRLCFLVNVRKATGRSMDGGKRIGRTDVFPGRRLGFPDRIGRAGVPKAGEDEGMSESSLPREGSAAFGVDENCEPSILAEVPVIL